MTTGTAQAGVKRPGAGKLAILALLVIVVLGAVVYWWARHGAAGDLSGVWKGQNSGQVFVLDRQDDDYRLTVGGRRLLVQSVDHDASHGQVSLTVRTDSGLRAVWTFADTGAEPRALQLDQDGLASETLLFQRALTSTDKVRISRLKPGRKPLWSPAFNCEKAATDVERLICTDRDLASLDVRLNQTLKTAPEAERAGQRDWLKDVRDACADLACLRDAYASRLDGLAEAAAEMAEPVDTGEDSAVAESE